MKDYSDRWSWNIENVDFTFKGDRVCWSVIVKLRRSRWRSAGIDFVHWSSGEWRQDRFDDRGGWEFRDGWLQIDRGSTWPSRKIELVNRSSWNWEKISSPIAERRICRSMIVESRVNRLEDRRWASSMTIHRRIERRSTCRWTTSVYDNGWSWNGGEVDWTIDEWTSRWLSIAESTEDRLEDRQKMRMMIFNRWIGRESARRWTKGECNDHWAWNREKIDRAMEEERVRPQFIAKSTEDRFADGQREITTMVDRGLKSESTRLSRNTDSVDGSSSSRETINLTIDEEFARWLCSFQWIEVQVYDRERENSSIVAHGIERKWTDDRRRDSSIVVHRWTDRRSTPRRTKRQFDDNGSLNRENTTLTVDKDRISWSVILGLREDQGDDG